MEGADKHDTHRRSNKGCGLWGCQDPRNAGNGARKSRCNQLVQKFMEPEFGKLR